MEASNVKAMREALEAINCIDTRGLKRLLCELVEADIFDCGLINKTIAAVEKARHALAAPPRNCDKFGTDDCEATVAYEDYCEKCEIAETADGAISWLLALATENKGGAK